MDTFRIIERIAYMLPEVLALFVAIFCIGRSIGSDTVLMLVGSILDILTSAASIVIWEVLWDRGALDGVLEIANHAVNYTGILARLMLFSGVLLFAMKRLPPRNAH